MDDDWAKESLNTIRTLMERAALYRHALAPAALFTGSLGTAASAVALFLRPNGVGMFVIYWICVALLVAVGVFFLIRRDAIRAGDPLWSPPARRVIQAMTPAIVIGLIVSSVVAFEPGPRIDEKVIPILAGGWMVLFGIALHAAGFFLQRGIKLFGWLFMALGLGAALFDVRMPSTNPAALGNVIMGASFGGLHLAYGLYLYFTERTE